MELKLVTEYAWNNRTAEASASYIVFATGDGPTENRILEGFAHQFDGNEIRILTFKSPLKSRTTGLASLKIVRIYIDEFRVRQLVWSCDKEHLSPQDDSVHQIKAKLTSLGMNVTAVTEWNDAARLDVALGQKESVLWCALTGKQSCLEENLSDLIYLELGDKVTPDKQGVRSALKSRGLSLAGLIRLAKKDNLKQAIPSLFNVFDNIERDCSAS
jgi:hypothetical protein